MTYKMVGVGKTLAGEYTERLKEKAEPSQESGSGGGSALQVSLCDRKFNVKSNRRQSVRCCSQKFRSPVYRASVSIPVLERVLGICGN